MRKKGKKKFDMRIESNIMKDSGNLLLLYVSDLSSMSKALQSNINLKLLKILFNKYIFHSYICFVEDL